MRKTKALHTIQAMPCNIDHRIWKNVNPKKSKAPCRH